MRTHIRLGLVAALAALAISSSPAAAAAPAWFGGADRNSDGLVTWGEFVRGNSKFNALDEDANGLITENEQASVAGAPVSSWAYVSTMDANRNGAVSRAEYNRTLRAEFDAYDVDQNGSVTDREADGV